MNKRILKIDIHQLGHKDEPCCRAYLSGKDKDGDDISITLTGYDAQQVLSLAQDLANQTDNAVTSSMAKIIDEQLGAEEHC